jgi:hypothetical protein
VRKCMPLKSRKVKLKTTGTVQSTRIETPGDVVPSNPIAEPDNDDEIVFAAPAPTQRIGPSKAILGDDDESDDGAGPSASAPVQLKRVFKVSEKKRVTSSEDEV